MKSYDYEGEVMVINDHGNVSLGYIDDTGEFVLTADCV